MSVWVVDCFGCDYKESFDKQRNAQDARNSHRCKGKQSAKKVEIRRENLTEKWRSQASSSKQVISSK